MPGDRPRGARPSRPASRASILQCPYVSERIGAWIIEQHTVFQFNHFGCHVGIDPDLREPAYHDDPYFDDVAEFADLHDSESFDSVHTSTLPLEEFEPLLHQVFDLE